MTVYLVYRLITMIIIITATMKKLNGRGKQSVKTLTNSRKNYSHHDY